MRSSDQLAPLLGFFGNELAKIGRRSSKYRGSQVRKSRLQRGIDEPRVDFGVELVNDLSRRVSALTPRRANAGRFEIEHPGDYATFSSNHSRDATFVPQV